MKRRYETVSIGESTSVGQADKGFAILLDGRPVKTPGRKPLVLPNAPLAEAVAAEWEAQGETLKPAEMHLTAFATTALDRAEAQRETLVGTVAGYAATDLLYYRAVSPAELAQRQEEHWQPILDWATLTFDAPLAVTTGILPIDQPEASLQALRGAVQRWDGLRLVPLVSVADQLGSAVLALALAHGRLSAAEAVAVAHVDEDYQAELWGWDAEAAVRRRKIGEEVAAAETFLRLLDR